MRRFQLPAWDLFASIEKHYADNKYSYELISISNNAVRYKEYYNSTPIREIDFEENDLSWKILKLTNKNIINKEELLKKLDCDSEIINNKIKELRDVGLLYVGKQSKECVSIINTQNIL